MVKKKSVKKKTVKKKTSKKKIIKKKTAKNKKFDNPIIKPIKATSNRFNIAFKNLALFLILTLISITLYFLTSPGTIYNNLFYVLSVLMGILVFTFILIILILLFLRILER